MIRLFKNLQIIRMFSKKEIIFYKKFGGAQAPLGHQVALPLALNLTNFGRGKNLVMILKPGLFNELKKKEV